MHRCRRLAKLSCYLAAGLFASFLAGCASDSYELSHDQTVAMSTASASVMQWATNAALSAFNYDYQNYQLQQQQTSRYFMPDAWTNYQAALKNSGELNSVLAHRLTVSAVTSANTATVANVGLINGKPSWIISVPLDVSYTSKHSVIRQHRVITMVILEVPNSPNHQIAINQFVVQ